MEKAFWGNEFILQADTKEEIAEAINDFNLSIYELYKPACFMFMHSLSSCCACTINSLHILQKLNIYISCMIYGKLNRATKKLVKLFLITYY